VRDELRRDLPMLQPILSQPNANGHHMLDIGFMKYVNLPTPASYNCYPVINGDEVDLRKYRLPEKYIVLTPGATAPNKEMMSETHNAIIEWTLARGWTPVVMGKRVVEIAYQPSFSKEIRYDKCLDLRDKTDTLEAACILANAQAVTGLDNGLTNLAACSMVPIVLAFTISDIQVPRRRDGAKTVVIGQPESLACRYCSRTMRFTKQLDDKGKWIEARTTGCITGTLECLKNITPERMTGGLDEIFKGA
jgi:ADP-heptose:LPS heptosyltransferase